MSSLVKSSLNKEPWKVRKRRKSWKVILNWPYKRRKENKGKHLTHLHVRKLIKCFFLSFLFFLFKLFYVKIKYSPYFSLYYQSFIETEDTKRTDIPEKTEPENKDLATNVDEKEEIKTPVESAQEIEPEISSEKDNSEDEDGFVVVSNYVEDSEIDDEWINVKS